MKFKVIMRPLFESYKLCVHGESWGDFLRSVADWAATSLSLPNLRTGGLPPSAFYYTIDSNLSTHTNIPFP